MASRTRPGKKNRVVATPCELTTEVSSSKTSCKGSLSLTNPQAKISTSSFQTTNVQAPTPLPQSLQERMLEIKEQPILEESQAPTKFEIMQEVLGKCRGYIRGLGHGPKPASSHGTIDLTSTDKESIALRRENREA
ncbi:hypothetical protein Adt_14378 [Abeliophyllum distichum]|uniref:Uncharacterized protein n=1 Tax=Abeliophyllum distichum TaxID=126358 RepID=A0ABD1TZG8_9LAMI